MDESPSREANRSLAMEPEGSLPHSQVPTICPYPEPDQSSLCLPIAHLEDPY
jgi:hypothetical protein